MYFIRLASTASPVLQYCDTVAGVSLGGDGATAQTASYSCLVLKLYWSKRLFDKILAIYCFICIFSASGVYYIKSKRGIINIYWQVLDFNLISTPIQPSNLVKWRLMEEDGWIFGRWAVNFSYVLKMLTLSTTALVWGSWYANRRHAHVQQHGYTL